MNCEKSLLDSTSTAYISIDFIAGTIFFLKEISANLDIKHGDFVRLKRTKDGSFLKFTKERELQSVEIRKHMDRFEITCLELTNLIKGIFNIPTTKRSVVRFITIETELKTVKIIKI